MSGISGSYDNSVFNFWGMLWLFSPREKAQPEKWDLRIYVGQAASPICVYPSQPTLDFVFTFFLQQRKVSAVGHLRPWPVSRRAVSGCP